MLVASHRPHSILPQLSQAAPAWQASEHVFRSQGRWARMLGLESLPGPPFYPPWPLITVHSGVGPRPLGAPQLTPLADRVLAAGGWASLAFWARTFRAAWVSGRLARFLFATCGQPKAALRPWVLRRPLCHALSRPHHARVGGDLYLQGAMALE